MTVADWQKIDGEHLADSLRAIQTNLQASNGELVLDFTLVARIDAEALTELSRLADQAEHKKIRLVLLAVNVDAYKVLKLAKLTERLSFRH